IGDVEVAPLVEPAEVAEAREAVGGGQRRVGAEVLEPPADILGVAHVDLADLAGRELAAVGVEDADVGAVAAAGAPPVRGPLVAAQQREADTLRRAVAHEELLLADEIEPR